ncbi:MAG: hypothetical protein GQ569_03715 [Methylococcaceae bacterium]|nr:hypothetical protein [Methylococcaceae bacterium]
MKRFQIYLFYLLLMLCWQNAFAEVAAKVFFAKGETYLIDSAGKQTALKKGSTLQQGDTVITKDDSRLELRFTDGGKIVFYDNSEFKIDDYHFSEKSDGNEKALFYFVKGVFRTIVGSIKKERYQVKTNVASIGTRGTEYLAELGNTLQVDVFEGTVILKNQAGDFAVAAGHSALMSDMLSMPEFITLDSRRYDQSGNKNNRQPKDAGAQGGDSPKNNPAPAPNNNPAPTPNNNPLNNSPAPSSNNNPPPRNREQDSHRRNTATPSNITIENILNGTISVEEAAVLPPPLAPPPLAPPPLAPAPPLTPPPPPPTPL